ncbi:transcriptional regulator NrdR [Candidatus Roizmanbacteria bacterium RIFCSPLOWO2_02_FULL_37_19]|nr:MAG: transcriptional regulator NrdR [Candidatus Roizmanbacteria bacterium RIFCSPLOWO2_02_FULL_37_19]
MHCIFCGNKDTDVVETRTSDDGMTVRRRRECSKCVKRFTTYERVEQLPIIVVKRDGRRERFDRDKLKSGILKSTGKTTITLEQVEEIVNNVESDLKQEDTTEVESQKIGENVAKYLKKLDKIAYIRFASVFRRFVDVEDFEKEVKKLL